MVVFLGVLWSLWGAAWLRRVELHHDYEPVVRDLGLSWAREGFGPSVRARGAVSGREVEVRWRRGVVGQRARVRVDGVWRTFGGGGEELRRLIDTPS